MNTLRGREEVGCRLNCPPGAWSGNMAATLTSRDARTCWASRRPKSVSRGMLVGLEKLRVIRLRGGVGEPARGSRRLAVRPLRRIPADARNLGRAGLGLRARIVP